mmetsp:Transcript_9528/g.24555  ORF Transcript_9528/g.24555 Transcript_9528/m.24555 type:complete len:748 (+) Transcript_9528:52-2295(+)
MRGGDEGMNQMDGGMQFGLMNAFRTGNMIFDVLICMLIPIVIRSVFGSNVPNQISQYISDWVSGKRNFFVRSIAFETKSGGGYYYNQSDDLDSKERNNLLQKAMRLFLSEECNLSTRNGDIFLIPSKKVNLEKDRWGDECRFSGSYQQLMSYTVTMLPAQNVWVQVQGKDDGKPKVWFRSFGNEREEAGGGDSRTTVRTVTFEVKAKDPGGEKAVDAWINKVFDWYRNKKASEQDQSRYFLQAQSKTSDATEFTYKKYLLSSHKCFDTLFFPEKRPLLNLVDDFLQKRGKFGIQGFPHKLGLLLDGPPGTGKTSLIKAIAHYTKRHIVSVSLDRISTNQELMDMMFDMKFAVVGADEPMVSKMDEIVFVMEDVDAASSVVYAREGTTIPGTRAANALWDVSEESEGAAAAPAPVDKASEGAPSTDASPAIGGGYEVLRTISAPSEVVRTVSRGKLRAEGISSAPISKETKNNILKEMAKWGPEKNRGPDIKYRAQLEKFFEQAEVPYAPVHEKVATWCHKQGAVSIMECFENIAALCKAVELKPLESARLKALANNFLGKSETKNEDGDNGGDGDEEDALQSALWAQMMAFEAFGSGGDSNDAASGGDKGGAPDAPPIGPFMGSKKGYSSFVKDKLNLAGLLNVLDGVVDTPGRILVMTTNHPEKLDPALIRPGRINKRLHLGYCGADSVNDMATHYLQCPGGMSPEQLKICVDICNRQQVTPAWVEQCCAEVDTFDELLERLKRST